MSMGPYTKQTAMEINYRPEKSLSWYQLLIFSLVVIQKVRLLRRGRGGEVIEKQTKMNMGRGPSMCVHSLFLKKMLRFSKWSFIDILQFFLLIVMTVLNIKPSWNIIFSPVNECCAIAFASHFYFAELLVLFSVLSIIVLAHFQQKWLLINWL